MAEIDEQKTDLSNEIEDNSIDDVVEPETGESTANKSSSKTAQNYLKVIVDPGSDYVQHEDVQDFEVLRDQCLEKGIRFEDPYFETSDLSSYTGVKNIEWMRPGRILEYLGIKEKPQFIVKGATRFDVNQGFLGDCWLISAMSNLTLNDTMFNHVVPNDQGFEDKIYAGIFHFRIWRFGKWFDVVVDDRLPTLNGTLIFNHTVETKNEFWSALLEKAYAKCRGSYETLKADSPRNAMVDFTGGVSQLYALKDPPIDLFDILYKSYVQQSFMFCSISQEALSNESDKTPENLVKNHAYSILKVKCIDYHISSTTTKVLHLLKLRNPWGSVEWNGTWNNERFEVDEAIKKLLNLKIEDDGEFWIEYDDFIRCFDVVHICYFPFGFNDDQSKNELQQLTIDGEWKVNEENPQYDVSLEDINEGKYSVVISLMTKKNDSSEIGFTVWKDEGTFIKKTIVMTSREVSRRLLLTPGSYHVEPFNDLNEKCEFLLRVFWIPIKDNDENEVESDKVI